MKFRYKVLSLLLILLITISYALYQRNRFLSLEMGGNDPILQKLPSFNVPLIGKTESITENAFIGKTSAFYVHFWGTWCGPCEAELPDFLDFAKNNESKSVRFLLIAVSDTDQKVNKFLKKFTIPENVILGIDRLGQSMPYFGTVKVPETYLFDTNGSIIKKYVGAQDWKAKEVEADLANILK